MKKKILIPLILVLLVAGGVVAFPYIRGALSQPTAQNYQTQPAEMGSLTGYVGATGAVRSNQSARLAWQTSGKVATVPVKKGQAVKSGALLSELAQTSLSQAIINASAELVNAQTALEDVLDNSEARSAAQLALIDAQKALEDAEKESQSKLYQRASESTIDIARANLILANEELDRSENIYEQYKGLGEDSPVYASALSEYARARQEQQKADYNLRYVQGLPDALDVEEVYAKLEQAQVKLLAAKEEWERIKDGPDPDDIAVAQARVSAAQATLDLARLTAPFDGVITAVEAQPGDLVSAGTLAFQVDDLSRLLVDVQISEIDINSVQVGQSVSLTFDAIPNQEYAGVVTDIASVGASEGGAVNYNVTVEIPPATEIRPGMTAAVNVAVSQLDDVLLIPARAVRVQDGVRMIYVMRDGVPTPVEVELGAASDTQVQVVSGDVQTGDLVILNPPSSLVMPGMMGRMQGGSGSGQGTGAQP